MAFNDPVDVTGTITCFRKLIYGCGCWGIVVPGRQYPYTFANTSSIPNEWKVEGKQARVIGTQAMSPQGNCVYTTGTPLTVTSIQDPQGLVCNNGEVKCNGLNKVVCENNMWIDKGCDGSCGDCGTAECNPGATKCNGTEQSICNNGKWEVVGCTGGCGSCNGATSGSLLVPAIIVAALGAGAYFLYTKYGK